MTTDLAYATIEELAPHIASGELSPVELTQAQLDRIAAHDGRLKSYATVMADSALAQAQQAADEIAAGNYRGPLHGIPIAVKDLCYTTGVRTMGGTKVLEEFVPEFDSTVVARFKDAGAVMLGKLNLTEGAMAGYNRARQVPVNPWDAGRWTGVSSSGSGVATAAGLCYASLGSDTGGSIRWTIRVMRHRRSQADLGSGEPLRRARPGAVARPRRTDVPLDLGLRSHARGDRRRRPERSDHAPGTGSLDARRNRGRRRRHADRLRRALCDSRSDSTDCGGGRRVRRDAGLAGRRDRLSRAARF